MIRLSKIEKEYLMDNGCVFHKDLHSTAKGNNTYATENDKVLGLLSQMYGREYKVRK